jgi:hypothetical protein
MLGEKRESRNDKRTNEPDEAQETSDDKKVEVKKKLKKRQLQRGMLTWSKPENRFTVLKFNFRIACF